MTIRDARKLLQTSTSAYAANEKFKYFKRNKLLERINADILLVCTSELAHAYVGQNRKNREVLVAMAKAICAVEALLQDSDMTGEDRAYLERLIDDARKLMLHSPDGGVLTQVRQDVTASPRCHHVRAAVERKSAEYVLFCAACKFYPHSFFLREMLIFFITCYL